jgi:HSP20 family protein
MYGRCHTRSSAAESRAAFGKYGFPDFTKFGAGRGGFFRRPKYNVPINIIEHDTYYEVHVYALGFSKEHIKISLADDVLYISGSKKLEENQDPVFLYQEYPVKTFERTVSLKGQIEPSAITARQEEGILKIVLPKTAQAQQPVQEIQVN